jgi:hypothetical protein
MNINGAVSRRRFFESTAQKLEFPLNSPSPIGVLIGKRAHLFQLSRGISHKDSKQLSLNRPNNAHNKRNSNSVKSSIGALALGRHINKNNNINSSAVMIFFAVFTFQN